MRVEPQGTFSLAEARGFGFGPRDAQAVDEPLRLAFASDDGGAPAGAAISEDAGGLDIELVGAAGLDQVLRILSLDHDGRSYDALGARDPVLGAVQARYPGLRPVLFHSPYEAACWMIISLRQPRRSAIAQQDLLARELGGMVIVADEEIPTFPAPDRLLEGIHEEHGLDAERVRRLRGIAEAALEGRLDAAALRALDPDDARTRLRELRGIGPFAADLIVVRACGHADVLPKGDELGRRAVAHYYGARAELEAVAESWRPFRTWALVALRVAATRDGVVPRR